MFPVDFKYYVSQNPSWQEENNIYLRESDTYRRRRFNYACNGVDYSFYFAVNVKTGEIYNNDTKRVIFAKNLGLVIGRPIYCTIKTLYHASIIAPLAVEIFKCVKHGQSGNDLAFNLFRSFADIVRTPLFGLALTVVHVAGVIFAAVVPTTLYKIREIVGKMERELHWGKKPSRSALCFEFMGYLTPCFSPITHIALESANKTLLSYADKYAKYHTAAVNTGEERKDLRRVENRKPCLEESMAI